MCCGEAAKTDLHSPTHPARLCLVAAIFSSRAYLSGGLSGGLGPAHGGFMRPCSFESCGALWWSVLIRS